MKNVFQLIAISTIIWLGIILILTSVSGQAEQQKGGTLEQLAAIMQKNNDLMAKNTEIIKGIPDLIAEQYQKQTGSIIVGTTLGMVMLYLVISLFERRRRIYEKKRHEEYIQELEEKQAALIKEMAANEAQVKEIIERLKQIPQNPTPPQETPPQMDKSETALNTGTIMTFAGVMLIMQSRIEDIWFGEINLTPLIFNFFSYAYLIIGMRLWYVYFRHSKVKV